jgi:hypothetical protein
VVRHHTRLNLLAYGLLKGTPYEVMERKCHEPPEFDKVATIARRFGGAEETIASWTEEARAHLALQE